VRVGVCHVCATVTACGQTWLPARNRTGRAGVGGFWRYERWVRYVCPPTSPSGLARLQPGPRCYKAVELASSPRRRWRWWWKEERVGKTRASGSTTLHGRPTHPAAENDLSLLAYCRTIVLLAHLNAAGSPRAFAVGRSRSGSVSEAKSGTKAAFRLLFHRQGEVS
jgi:hypothetical protein